MPIFIILIPLTNGCNFILNGQRPFWNSVEFQPNNFVFNDMFFLIWIKTKNSNQIHPGISTQFWNPFKVFHSLKIVFLKSVLLVFVFFVLNCLYLQWRRDELSIWRSFICWKPNACFCGYPKPQEIQTCQFGLVCTFLTKSRRLWAISRRNWT